MNIGIFSHLFGAKQITEERIREFATDTNVKRICFSRIQKHALWKTPDEGEDMITIPFIESIGKLLKAQTGIELQRSGKGNYYKKLSKEEFEKVSAFVSSYGDVVFLRDLLNVSVALSLNFEDGGEVHTPIGLLEKNAKYDADEEAMKQLAAVVDDFIETNPLYAAADYICAIPPSKTGTENLPMKVVKTLTKFKGADISDSVSWTSKAVSLKNAEGADKLEMLKHSGFAISPDTDLKGKTVMLVDDLYMSGITLQYVAMKLMEAGVSEVYGLCFVKSFSNR